MLEGGTSSVLPWSMKYTLVWEENERDKRMAVVETDGLV